MLADAFRRPSRLLAACMLIALSGCANKVLNNQLATSRDAVDQAQIVGAAQIAPQEFSVAVDKLDRANAAAKRKDVGVAMTLAREAQADASLARARTNSSQARTAAAELEKSNQILREEIAYTHAHQNQGR